MTISRLNPNTAPRVLFLAYQIGPGGVGVHMMNLARGLMDRGWQVALASRGRAGKHPHGPEWFEAAGVRHFTVPFPEPRFRASSLRSAVLALANMDAVVRHWQPDLVHVHWRLTSPFAAAMRVSRGIPYVSSLHVDQTPSGTFHRLLSFWGQRAICVSRETYDDLAVRFRVPTERIRTVYYGVDETKFRPPTALERIEARTALGLRSEDRVVSLLGGEFRRKGHDVLIRALGELRASGHAPLAVLAGDIDQEQRVRELAADVGASDLLRLVGYADSRIVLWASDVFVLPSRKEGLPVAVVEAMLCGTVPVRTPAAGARDQIQDGVNGFVVPFDDHVALAQRLQQLLADDSLRSTMSAAAVDWARERFTLNRMVSSTIQVYEDARATAGSPRRPF